MKKVKIVATLGPSSDTKEMILTLAKKGVNVFRLNLSHYKVEKSLEVIKTIRAAEKEFGQPLAIMGDLAGPKIRIGDVEPGVVLTPGARIDIVIKSCMGNSKQVCVNFPSILKFVEKGADIFIADGIIKLRAEKVSPEKITAKVLTGGPLTSRKGFSAHGISLAKFELNKKDKEDIKAMVEGGADALAVSFVQDERDIRAVKKMLPANSSMMIIAKIETAAGVKNAQKILEEADGLMVARGDLGFSIPMAHIPHVQKELINICLRKAKPVITATQMLESMIHNPLPTRAEVSDIANAVLDGTDAVMLSQETAMGKFPEQVVETMATIIQQAEEHVEQREFPEDRNISDAISASVVRVADQVQARVLMVFTQKGPTARRIARHRHRQPIIALTPELATMRRICFTWGAYPVSCPVVKTFVELAEQAKKIARNNDICKLKKDEPFVISAGVPFGKSGSTNLLSVVRA